MKYKRLSIALPESLMVRIKKARLKNGFNVSAICKLAIESELKRIEKDE